MLGCPQTCKCDFVEKGALYVRDCRIDPKDNLSHMFQSYPTITSLEITNSKLSVIPCELATLTQLTNLIISQNFIQYIPCNLSNLTRLTSLDLSHNGVFMWKGLKAFPCQLSNLSQLQTLDLSYNIIESVACNLSNMTKLTSLDLSRTQVKSFPCELSTLHLLTHLDLSWNQLQSIRCDLSNMTHLSSLDLSYSDMKEECDTKGLCTFPYDLSTLTYLTFLDLSYNLIQNVPCQLSHLTQLISLNLSSNNIESFTCDLSNLTRLSSLKLSQNHLIAFPSELSIPAQIVSIDLSLNRIKSLSCSLSAFSKLTFLDLSYNKIELVPCDLSNLTHLNYFDLSSNRIHSMPRGLSQLTQMAYLNLANNALHEFPLEILYLAKLKFLDLSGNPIKSLPSNMSSFRQLLHLKLRGTQLSTFPSQILLLTQLSSLDLSLNYIKSLPYDLVNLTRLNSLDLSQNILESVTYRLSHLTKLSSLNLEQNNIHTFPCEISTLTNLTSVKIGDNKIASVPCDLSGWSQLISLDISYNMVQNLDSWPITLAKDSNTLKTFNFDGNHLSQFTNHAGAQATSCKAFKGQVISLEKNNITHLMDVLKGWNLKISTVMELHECFQIFIPKFYGNPLTCDCTDYELFRFLKHIKFFYYRLQCHQPHSLWRKDPLKLSLDQFVCNISADCPIGCYCTVIPFNNSVMVNCERFEGNLLPQTMPRLPNENFWYHLNMDNMNLTNVSYAPYLTKMRTAKFSRNSISEVSVAALIALQNVIILNLDHNMLWRLPDNITTVKLDNLTDLTLGENPWVCDCTVLSTKQWIEDHKRYIKDFYSVTCHSPPSVLYRNLIYTEKYVFCPEGNRQMIIYIITTVFGTSFLLICTVCFVFLKTRKWVRAKQLANQMVLLDGMDADKQFDVFISYATEDEDYILDDFIPELENHDFKVCFHRIHFLGGNTIIDNISECINNSKRTLVFFSNFYKNSHFCMWEFKEALNKDLREGTIRLITIKDTDLDTAGLDDSTRAYFQRRTYIEKDAVKFWENLLHSLPKTHNDNHDIQLHEL